MSHYGAAQQISDAAESFTEVAQIAVEAGRTAPAPAPTNRSAHPSLRGRRPRSVSSWSAFSPIVGIRDGGQQPPT